MTSDKRDITISEWVAQNCPGLIDGVDIRDADEALHAMLILMQDARLEPLRDIHKRMRKRHRELKTQLDAQRRAFETLRDEIAAIGRINRSHV